MFIGFQLGNSYSHFKFTNPSFCGFEMQSLRSCRLFQLFELDTSFTDAELSRLQIYLQFLNSSLCEL